MTNWLAFDIGTTGTKAAFINDEGHIGVSAYASYETRFPGEREVEQNCLDWWQAVKEVCQQLRDAPAPDAIAVTGQMQNLILLDDKMKPIHPVILYSDSRATEEAQQIIDILGVNLLRQLTGNDQGPGGLLAKLLWVSRHAPEFPENVAGLCFGAGEFVASKMVGKRVSDRTTASTTGLIDISTRGFLDATLFERLGLAEVFRLLPDLVDGGARIGDLQADVAVELGLPAGIPVHLAPGDAGAATLGAGSGESGAAYAYVGTSGWVAFSAETPADPEKGVITLLHPGAGRYIQVAPMMTAGGNLEWLKTLFEVPDYDQLIEASLAREARSLLYLPYLNGERSPFIDPFARGVFVGLSSATQAADMGRAVLEGVVYAYKHVTDALIETGLSSITLTGGGTRSLAWCQLFADILGIEVHISANAENVGLRGAVLSAQVADGKHSSFSPVGYFPVQNTLYPVDVNRDIYLRKYEVFRQLHKQLAPAFSQLSGL